MSIQRYSVDHDGMLKESNTGSLVRVRDHWKEVVRLQKIIDDLAAKNADRNKRPKLKDDDKVVVSYKLLNNSTRITDTISYKNLQSYLNLVSHNDYVGLTVCVLHPLKVVEKKSLTVEL